MNQLSAELRAVAQAILESHRTGYSVSPTKLLNLAERAAELERQVQEKDDAQH